MRRASLKTTARFFEVGRSTTVVALWFRFLNLDRGHRLGVGSFKALERDVVRYKRMQNGAGHQLDYGVCV